MSTTIDSIPAEGGQYEQMRDSFYILSVMNQFSIKQNLPRVKVERLLRVALFSDTLELSHRDNSVGDLVSRRRKLARNLREGRKKGVVPVFISLMWFLYSLIISIQQAFGQIGSNATAQNLALGPLLSWLPTFILCSIVDRNPVQPEAVRYKLNKFIDTVRKALLDTKYRDVRVENNGVSLNSSDRTIQESNASDFQGDLFTQFAGQGRVRWHYGIASGTLDSVEESYIAAHGRNWLQDSAQARAALIQGPPKPCQVGPGFHAHQLWQILAAFLSVGLGIFGGFLIVYQTPTIGIGCRARGYLIFFVIACTSLVIELVSWRWLPMESTREGHSNFQAEMLQNRQSRPSRDLRGKLSGLIQQVAHWWQNSRNRDLIEMGLLRPLECVNTIWLIYIVMAQTVGAYENCDCLCSILDYNGGYMDLETQSFYLQFGVGWFWGLGTAMGSIPMLIAFTYIVLEWCVHSNLSTEDYEAARRGSMLARRYRALVQPINILFDFSRAGLMTVLSRPFQRGDTALSRPRLRWTSRVTDRTSIGTISQIPSEPGSNGGSKLPLNNTKEQPFILDILPSPERPLYRSSASSYEKENICHTR